VRLCPPDQDRATDSPQEEELRRWRGSFFEAVRLLLALGADVHARDAVYDGTPRDWADFQRRTEMVAFLDGLMHPAG
jgi:hypothetical protein